MSRFGSPTRPLCGYTAPVGKSMECHCTLPVGHQPYGKFGHFDGSTNHDFGDGSWHWFGRTDTEKEGT